LAWVSIRKNRSSSKFGNGRSISICSNSSCEDLGPAAEAAQKAFKTWSKTAVPRRVRILFRYQQLLIENWDELAKLITLENGKS
jgi:malonate-semialdehyde dehydrogenase (acetylating)/methylmalonate-semialdehyde dehydrogenase